MSTPPSNINTGSNNSQLAGRKRKLPDPPGQSDNEPLPPPPASSMMNISTATAAAATAKVDAHQHPPPAVKAKLDPDGGISTIAPTNNNNNNANNTSAVSKNVKIAPQSSSSTTTQAKIVTSTTTPVHVPIAAKAITSTSSVVASKTTVQPVTTTQNVAVVKSPLVPTKSIAGKAGVTRNLVPAASTAPTPIPTSVPTSVPAPVPLAAAAVTSSVAALTNVKSTNPDANIPPTVKATALPVHPNATVTKPPLISGSSVVPTTNVAPITSATPVVVSTNVPSTTNVQVASVANVTKVPSKVPSGTVDVSSSIKVNVTPSVATTAAAASSATTTTTNQKVNHKPTTTAQGVVPTKQVQSYEKEELRQKPPQVAASTTQTPGQDVQMKDVSSSSTSTKGKIIDQNNPNPNNGKDVTTSKESKDVEMEDVGKEPKGNDHLKSTQDGKMTSEVAPSTSSTTDKSTTIKSTNTTKSQNHIFPSLSLEEDSKTPHILNLIKNTKMYENPKPKEKVNWETTMTILQSQDFPQVLSTLLALRDDFELLYSAEYSSALKVLVPAFMALIKSLPCTPPSNPFLSGYDSTSSGGRSGGELTSKTAMAKNCIYRIRNTILELSNLFPLNDTLRPYVIQLITMVTGVLRTDYEENALLASKVIVELHKNYRMILSDYAEQYLEFVLMSYRSLSSNVQQNFTFKATVQTSTGSSGSASTITSSVGQESSTSSAAVQSPAMAKAATHHEPSIIIEHALKSVNSFRILTECPLTVILIFQLYPQFIKRYLMQLLPLMMEALGQRPLPFSSSCSVPTMTPIKSQQTSSAATTASSGGATTSKDVPTVATPQKLQQQQQKEYQVMSKKLYMKRSRELLSAQVKTLTFVTFLLSRYGEQLKPFEDHLATNVLNLFQMCPREAIVTRKDLLLALKHIFMTDFRKGFYKHIDLLLDDRVLVGKHKQSEHTHLRVEAYSALATLIPHVCSQMSMIHLSRVVHLYSRVLHDASMNLPLKSQMMSVNLMLCLIDTVYHNREERASLGRDILYRILENLVWKIGTFAKCSDVEENFEDVGMKVDKKESENDEVIKNRKVLSDIVYGNSSINSKEARENVENIIKLILGGFKKLLWCINTYGVQREKLKKSDSDKGAKDSKSSSTTSSTQSSQQCAWYEEMAIQTINLAEQKLIDSCLVWSLKSIRLFRKKKDTITENSDDAATSTTTSSSTDFTKALETLSAALSVMDIYSFQRVVGPRINLLFNMVMEEDDAIIVFQKLLLQNTNISSTFASCLIKFLMKNMRELSGRMVGEDEEGHIAESERKSVVIQKIFEIFFTSLSVHAKNETELRPHLQMLIASCLRQTTNSDLTRCPGANLEILRKLFRAVAGGKFEESYKEILPLLSPLLNGLFHIFCRAKDDVMRKVIIELCLTIPARLSSLLPHLSLLMRIIVPALNTDDGDLINLGLRTLEFWVENLNSEFFFSILSRDSDLFAGLMLALTSHLRPAPYQYGILTVRLLGKLGGKNRLFLQEPMDMAPLKQSACDLQVNLNCGWEPSSTFEITLPIQRAAEVLQQMAALEHSSSPQKKSLTKDCQKDQMILSENLSVEQFDISAYKENVVDQCTRNQSKSAFVILRVALSTVLNELKSSTGIEKQHSDGGNDLSLRLFMQQNRHSHTKTLKLICRGLFHASNVTSVRSEALSLLDGFTFQLIDLVTSSIENVSRSNHNQEVGKEQGKNEKSNLQQKRANVVSGKLQPLLPFGSFNFSGQLETKRDCLVMNEVIPEVLKSRNSDDRKLALSIMKKIFDCTKAFDVDRKTIEENKVSSQLSCTDIFAENMLHHLCHTCLASEWQERSGIYHGITYLLELMGKQWSLTFEVELIHVAVFCIKDHPQEVATAEKEALSFFFRLLSILYNASVNDEGLEKLHDNVSVPSHNTDTRKEKERRLLNTQPVSEAICSIMIGELGSPNSAVRLAARHFLKLLYGSVGSDDKNTLPKMLANHESATRRLLFSKSLRNLPLSEQIATIEAFTFIAKEDSKLLPLTENLVLVFFSELLKMMSVADGEMTSESISNAVIINKDGYSPKPECRQSGCTIDPNSSLSHASGIFLREEYAIKVPGLGVIVVPAALPTGVQFRVSSLILFHTVLRAHSDTFFEADPSSSIGNILPHIVSLLFRSLTSRPAPAVDAAHVALRDLLKLSIKNKNNELTHKLPKNLLQMCIRPVLLNLRDYTKLTIPLLRGLSRLLSLLSSWFSKTLGEKLLEHLQRWTDPDKIIGLGIWKRGEEPLVAAAIISLFELLPDDSSHFVELLVKTTLKLENALPRYKTCQVSSPFREPLAKYLNRHEDATAKFFVNDHRLKNPIYSDLLQDIVKRPGSEALRKKLSDNKWSTVILNVCFERPLAIIRAEKGGSSTSASSTRSQSTSSSPRNAAEILSMHGINIDLTGQGQKSAALRQVLDHKKEKLMSATKDHTKFKDRLEKLKRSEATATSEKVEKIKRSINNAKKQLDKTQIIVAGLKKEVESAQKEYTNEVTKFNRDSDRSDNRDPPRSMTFDALELQFQGFCLVQTLIENDTSYISEHTDVVRAFRWLWRSKGRHFRLYHEDSMPPRFNGESRVLAQFLVTFAKTSNDVDILFDLLRIFLQPTSSDFSFVQKFLKETVCKRLSIDQKKRVMQRFFPVIASEGIEELKVLSIQFLILPMLRNDFESSLNSKENASTENENTRILDKDLTNTFIKEVLLHSGKSRSYGNRLSIELLKLSSLLLQYMSAEMGDFHQDLLRFSWNLLKSEDVKTKQWACISICHYISAFPTPPKHILQIYAILLRSYHQDAKELASMAMDLLLPMLSRRLSPNNYAKIVQYTLKILFEEGNSIPTLSHIWDTIVRHESIFFEHKQRIIPHVLTSLPKLGFPISASLENRNLCLSMIELLMKWESSKTHPNVSGMPKNVDTLDTDFKAFVGLASPESSPTKKIKHLPMTQPHQQMNSLSERGDMKVAANFLIRFILLISASEKFEQTKVTERAQACFQRMLGSWSGVEIRSVYFDKLEALCIEENDSIYNEKKDSASSLMGGIENKNLQSRNKPSQDKSQPSQRKGETSKSVSTNLLSHCLNIFSTILESAPQNAFLYTSEDKICNILITCIHRAKDNKSQLKVCLQRFFTNLFQAKSSELHCMQERCKSCLETSLFDLYGPNTKSGQDSTTYDTLLFFLRLIEDIHSIAPNMIELFAHLLIVIAEKLSKVVMSTSMNKRNSNTSFTPSISSNVAIFNYGCEQLKSKQFSCVVGQKKEKNVHVKSLETTVETECLICCIRLLSKSQIPYTFTRNRERLFKIINDVLDSSSNVLLLLSSVVHIGQWLSMDKNSVPLSFKEQKLYLSKLSILQHRSLPEVESQPLFHAVAQTILNVASRHDISKCDSSPNNSLSALLQPLFGSLLVTENRLRNSLVDLFLQEFTPKMMVPACQGDTKGIEPQNTGNLLAQLFSCPIDDLGNRLLTFVFVDVLLGSLKYSGKIDLHIMEELRHRQQKQQISNDRSKGETMPKAKLHNAYEPFGTINDYQKYQDAISIRDLDGNKVILNAIRELAVCDIGLCQDLLEKVMSEAWSRYSNKERLSIIPKMERLLANPAHSQFLKIPSPARVSEYDRSQSRFHRDTNSIQMLLRAISKLRPLPMISIDVMLFLAKNYNCWHGVRSMLEIQSEELAKVSNKLPSEIIQRIQSAIRKCYLELGEVDVWMSMKVDTCNFADLKWASSLDMYGLVNKAMFAYDSIIDDMEAKLAMSQQKGNTENYIAPSETEISFIQDRWISSQKEMCQWAALEDFADNSGCSQLAMECAWKARDWEKLRNLNTSPSIVASLESGDIDAKMSEIFLAIADGKLNEVENLHAQTAQLCLYKWQLLPQIYSGCNSHNRLLHSFHRLVDIRESGQIMVETSKHAGRKTYPDLKNLLSAWRHRLPNDFDCLSVWDDIFQWRSHMYTAITTNFRWAEQGALASLHDRPWTSIKMAKIARKQNVPEVALLSLAKTDCAMDVSDAYAKLREQILSLRNGTEVERTGGLNLINTTNLEYFDSNQKGELIRLKAEFLDSLGIRTKATQAYCHAVQVCPSYAKTWISWGILCSSLADCVERQGRIQANEKKLDKEKSASNAKKIIQYLAQSIGCFMEAIMCESSDRARAHIPKCLQILSKDGMASGLLCSTFQKHASKLPSWVWLTWIPQLLTSLCRIEANAAKEILMGILSTYPQSIYFSLRSFYLERRDQDRARTSSDSKTGSSTVAQAEELMSSLRKSFPSLWISLESILEELIMRFRPSYEEELLTTIIALLQRAESQIEQQVLNNARQCDDKAVRASFAKTLSRVSAKFFRSSSDASSSTNSTDERSKRSAYFSLKYKETFEKDFSLLSTVTDSTDKNATLLEICSKLKKWKSILETQVSLCHPKLPLLQVSPTLSAVSSCAQDLWSGACVPTHSSSKNGRDHTTDPSSTQSSTAESATAASAAAVTASRAVAIAYMYEGNGGYYGTGCSSVEIPGQYSPNVFQDGKPTPELNAKLIKFESFVEISRQNDQFVRRIGMVGSDGKTYQFLLQFAVPYWTRTDERTAQLHQIFGHCLKKNKLSSQRNLWLKPTSVVPVAQRLRMTADDKNNISLHDIFMEYCISKQKEPSEPTEVFKNECKRKKTEDEQADKGVVKLHAYGEVCKVVPMDILCNAMRDHFNCAERYYFFQRSFASQLALNSLLQYTFDVNERSPAKLIFNCKNGQILSPDFRFSYSNQGFLDEKKAVPFRLTRNLSTFIGPNLMSGVFKPALSSAASAISADGQNLEPALQLLSRDDIVAWYLSKSAQRDGTQRSTQDLERHLHDRVKKNVYLIQNRMRECAPRNSKDSSPMKIPIDESVQKLISIATKAESQVAMPLSFSPWL